MCSDAQLRLQNRISTVITSLFVCKVKDLLEQQLIIMLSYKFANLPKIDS